MATSLFFIPTDQSSVVTNQNDFLRNTQISNSSGSIQTDPPVKSRGRKPGTKAAQQTQQKQRLRGMGVAQLERLRAEEEKRKIVAATGDTSATASPNTTLLPGSDPGIVLQGFPSYGGGPYSSSLRSRVYSGGVGSGQVDPVCSPWGFLERSTHELSSIPNLHCDTCFKKKRLDGDQSVVRSNGGGFSKYSPIPPPLINGYDYILQPDQRSQTGCFYDHRTPRSASVSASCGSSNPYFNEKTNHTGPMEDFGSCYMEGNPRNGTGGVKEYEFFPGKDVKAVSVATSVGDCSHNTSSTIDLSLKL